jgi:hypothetical protein
MEQKFFVAEAYRIAESGNWEYKLVAKYDTEYAAKQSYHSRLAAIMKPSNDIAMVILYDSYGHLILSDFNTTYVEPEPEPTPDSEPEE